MHSQRDTARTYYTEKLKQHGATARGVDWPSAASQYLRFVQLLKVCDFSRAFSINDFGCGYGALLEYFQFREPRVAIRYHGIDISPPMIEAAQRMWRHNKSVTMSRSVRNVPMSPIIRSPERQSQQVPAGDEISHGGAGGADRDDGRPVKRQRAKQPVSPDQEASGHHRAQQQSRSTIIEMQIVRAVVADHRAQGARDKHADPIAEIGAKYREGLIGLAG